MAFQALAAGGFQSGFKDSKGFIMVSERVLTGFKNARAGLLKLTNMKNGNGFPMRLRGCIACKGFINRVPDLRRYM